MRAEGAIAGGTGRREHVGRSASGWGNRALLVFLALVASATAALLFAAPSLAARGHEFAGAFGWGVLNGKSELQRCTSTPDPITGEPVSNCQTGLAGNGPGQFDHPAGIAVNEATGNVYVVDKANNRVEVFNAQGTKREGVFDGSGLNSGEGKAAGSGKGPEEIETGQFQEPEGIAVDNDPSSPSFGDVYVEDTNGHTATMAAPPVIDKFSASGEYIGQITRNPNGPEFSGFRELFGVAVDPQGGVWVQEQNFGSSPAGAANYTNAVANKWTAFRSTVKNAGVVSSSGLAVDSKHNLYVHLVSGGIDRLVKLSEDGTLITGEVDEEAPTAVAVEAKSDDPYIAHAENVHRVDPNGVSLEALKALGAPQFSGVAVNAKTLTVYAADSASSRIDVFAPEAPRAPTVQPGSEGVSDVSSTGANFTAEVNPRSEENEEATSYHFEYGPCDTPSTCSSSPYTQSIPVPEGQLVPNYEPDLVSAHPQGLTPHTTYHMRVVAHNSHPGITEGEEVIFTMQGTETSPLPDARQWELVSTPDKRGAILLQLEGSGIIQAAKSGDAITYIANAPSEAEPAGFSQVVQILSRRGSSAWGSEDIATPHEATVGVSIGSGQGEYRYFSEDLASAVVQPFGPFTQELSPAASEQTVYLRASFPAGDPSKPCSESCYRPLVTGCPGEGEPCAKAVEEAANVPEGTKFSEKHKSEGGPCAEKCGPYFLGASVDASHVVMSSKAPLAEGAEENGLYEWADGKLTLVSVLAGGEAAGANARPGLGFVNEAGEIRVARHAISADGSRVIWSANELEVLKKATGNQHLYLHQTGKETLQLDKPEAACKAKGKCTGNAHPVFQDASTDGSRIFFSDSQPLTQSSGNSDLYECQIEEDEEGQPSCKLSDLTPPGAGEEGAGVLGLVAGAAEDSSALYFTANGKLSGPSARGEEAVAGDCEGNTFGGTPESETAPERCNLYERSGGQTKLIAVLSGADFPDWSLRESFGLRGLSDRVSPDGRYLAFMSRRSLSGYDNTDAASFKADQEVFLYDNATNSLICASCDPSGARPRGVPYAQIDSDNGGLAGGEGVFPAGAWIAAELPSWAAPSETEGFALHQPRYLSNSGRLFFNSADALSPQDSNKTQDVYESEPSGVGDCTSSSSTFDPLSGGCLALLSSGEAKGESAFLDASESGDDAFFLTGARLLPKQDVDTSLDIYDAHACSGASPCLPEPPTLPPACEGDACQSPGAPPTHQTPGSLTYQGPGNVIHPAPPIAKPKPKTAAEIKAEKLKAALKSCRKKKSKAKRKACEAKARKLYGPHKAKKAKKAKKSARGTER